MYVFPAGVKRIGKGELKARNVDVSTGSFTYFTSNLTHSPEGFQRLVELNSCNVSNNRESIVSALEKGLNRKGLVHKASDEEK